MVYWSENCLERAIWCGIEKYPLNEYYTMSCKHKCIYETWFKCLLLHPYLYKIRTFFLQIYIWFINDEKWMTTCMQNHGLLNKGINAGINLWSIVLYTCSKPKNTGTWGKKISILKPLLFSMFNEYIELDIYSSIFGQHHRHLTLAPTEKQKNDNIYPTILELDIVKPVLSSRVMIGLLDGCL